MLLSPNWLMLLVFVQNSSNIIIFDTINWCLVDLVVVITEFCFVATSKVTLLLEQEGYNLLALPILLDSKLVRPIGQATIN